jgi:hypothetical protein
MASSGVMVPFITNGPAVAIPTIMLGHPQTITKHEGEGKFNTCVKGFAKCESHAKMPAGGAGKLQASHHKEPHPFTLILAYRQ